ncbi:glycosyltransferase family 4 protein [Phaeobacter sp. A36a-5a]|uniref:glycosyltransferase family 4 protein n=1 Tax=Phaeobacter bryozoorum TaxID=1086632 RepID=UPI0035A63D09
MSQDREYIDQEIAQIRFIYETLYPEIPVEAHMWWEEAKLPTPAVQPQDMSYGAEMMALTYIGNLRTGPQETPALPGKRVFVTIPSPRQVAVRESAGGVAWHKRPRKYRAIHALSPILAEQMKYQIEARRWRKLPARHKFSRLACSRGIFETQTMAPEGRHGGKEPAILIGLHWLDVGGAESLGIDSIRWALDAGLRVFVMVGQEGPERLLAKLPEDPRLQLIRTDRYLPRSQTSAFVSQLIAQENIILTHNHHCVPLYDALPTIKLRHPHVVNLDSTHIVEYADGGYPRISGVWSNFIDHHHVISGEYKERFRVYGSKLVLGRLLDDSRRGADVAPVRIRAGQTRCRVAFVGRMVHQKRPVVALSIIRRLRAWGKRNGVDFRFDMVGEGPYRGAVEHLLTRYRLADVVHLHPAGTDVPGLLGQSDILLVPSSNEGLALVCYEAIEAGCVPICSDVGAQAEICPPETLVAWSPLQAVRESVAVVQRLLREEGFAEGVEAGQRARMQALQNDPSAREVLSQLYRDALAAVAAERPGSTPAAAERPVPPSPYLEKKKRKLWLHIGSHKTGSTSLQIALRQGQMQQTLGSWSYLHAKPRVDFNPLIRNHKMGGNMYSELRWPFLERRMADADQRECGDCIIATEMLFWLMNPNDIRALHRRLREHFDEINVVAYLRRQDTLALSHRKQVILGQTAYQFYGAQLQALPVYRPHMMRYFDYATKLARWEEMFGAGNVTVRRFQRSDLVGGDTVLDFYNLVGLTPPDNPPRDNEAWSRSQILAGLWLRQQGFPKSSFEQILRELPEDGPLLPSRAEMQGFLARFDDINRRLAQRYDPEGPESFFDLEFDRYPEVANGGRTAAGGFDGDPVLTKELLQELKAGAEAECARQDLARDPLNTADQLLDLVEA